jgi:hypothetical protein
MGAVEGYRVNGGGWEWAEVSRLRGEHGLA